MAEIHPTQLFEPQPSVSPTPPQIAIESLDYGFTTHQACQRLVRSARFTKCFLMFIPFTSFTSLNHLGCFPDRYPQKCVKICWNWPFKQAQVARRLPVDTVDTVETKEAPPKRPATPGNRRFLQKFCFQICQSCV